MRDPKRLILLVAAGILIIAAAAILAGRAGMTEADRVREAIREAAAGAEDGSPKAVVARVSEQYRDRNGMSRQELKAFLFMQFQQRGAPSVLLSPIEVDIDATGEAAEARFAAAVAEGVDLSALEVLPKNAEAWRFKVSLRKEEGDWMIVGHERERVRDARALFGR